MRDVFPQEFLDSGFTNVERAPSVCGSSSKQPFQVADASPYYLMVFEALLYQLPKDRGTAVKTQIGQLVQLNQSLAADMSTLERNLLAGTGVPVHILKRDFPFTYGFPEQLCSGNSDNNGEIRPI